MNQILEFWNFGLKSFFLFESRVEPDFDDISLYLLFTYYTPISIPRTLRRNPISILRPNIFELRTISAQSQTRRFYLGYLRWLAEKPIIKRTRTQFSVCFPVTNAP